MFVIADLDGTLALVEHRRHHISGGRRNWQAFFEACDRDLPNPPVVETLLALDRAGHRIEIWSGRSDQVRAKTERWLEGHGLGRFPLRMRRAGDNTPDDILKQGWLQALDAPPDMVLDDRQKVVDMWRRNGIVCLQVAPGDF
jgi:hypothetical protein